MRLPKNPKVDGYKENFKNAEDILRIEEVPIWLVGLPKKSMVIGGNGIFKRMERHTLELGEAMVKHEKLPKNNRVVGYKFYKKVKCIMRIEDMHKG